MEIILKKCTRCGLEKPTSEYYIYKTRGFKLYAECKKCGAERLRESYWRNPNQYKAKKNERRRRRWLNMSDEQKKEHREHLKVQVRAWSFVKKIKMYRPNHCLICGTKCTPQGHHPDYLKPEYVIWCCIGCHRQIHRWDHRLQTVSTVLQVNA